METRGRPRIDKNELTKPAATAITPTLRKALERQAVKDGRTFSSQIRYACQRFINSRIITDDMGLS